jgi:DNA-binding IclR family transcriptional regulator
VARPRSGPNPELVEGVLRALREGPGSRAEIRRRSGVSSSSVDRIVKRLLEEGVIVRWRADGRAAIWGFEFERPPGAPASPREAVLSAARAAGSVSEIRRRTGFAESTVRRHVKDLVREGKLKRARARYQATGR